MKPPVFSCLAAHTTDNGSFYGRFLFGPLPVDVSLTLATILRRSLLHNKAPFIIISAEIEGATHEYAALPGIQESVLEILLNLGEIVLTGKNGNLLNPTFRSSRYNQHLSNNETYVASLKISGPCVVTAKDIYWPQGIYCVKPNAHIATLSSNNTLGIRIKIVSTSTPQAYPFEKPHIALFSKHLRSISTLSFAPPSTFKENQSIRLRNSLKRNSETPCSKTKTTFGFWDNKSETSLFKTRKNFNRSIGKKLLPLIKKPSVYYSLKQPQVLEVKVGKQHSNVFSGRSQHYPFLDFNVTSTHIKSTVPGILRLKNLNSVKGITKGAFTALTGGVSRDILSKRKKQLLDLFSGKENETFSLSLILQYLSQSFKKQAIKHLSFTQLFEYRLSRIKQLKEEPKSIEPWGNELAVTSSFYPVEKVNFVIERDDQLVGHRHRIVLEVWTNGSISPRQAIFDSINWVMKLLYSFREPIAPFEHNL